MVVVADHIGIDLSSKAPLFLARSSYTIQRGFSCITHLVLDFPISQNRRKFTTLLFAVWFIVSTVRLEDTGLNVSWIGTFKSFLFQTQKHFLRHAWYIRPVAKFLWSLQWRHNGHEVYSNQRRLDCLFNHLFRRRSKKTSKLRVTVLSEANSSVTGQFPAQRASNAENVSIWWRHHDSMT